jgi:DinB superfamily
MTALAHSRPAAAEYAADVARYIELVPEGDIVDVLQKQLSEISSLLGALTEQQANAVHPPYAWTIKQVIGHMIDAERVFGYRALRFARNDPQPLPGFDEGPYMENANFGVYRIGELTAEFENLRRSHISFFRHLEDKAWGCSGVANNTPVSVRALAYIIAGHAQHHLLILRKRLSAG